MARLVSLEIFLQQNDLQPDDENRSNHHPTGARGQGARAQHVSSFAFCLYYYPPPPAVAISTLRGQRNATHKTRKIIKKTSNTVVAQIWIGNKFLPTPRRPDGDTPKWENAKKK